MVVLKLLKCNFNTIKYKYWKESYNGGGIFNFFLQMVNSDQLSLHAHCSSKRKRKKKTKMKKNKETKNKVGIKK